MAKDIGPSCKKRSETVPPYQRPPIKRIPSCGPLRSPRKSLCGSLLCVLSRVLNCTVDALEGESLASGRVRFRVRLLVPNHPPSVSWMCGGWDWRTRPDRQQDNKKGADQSPRESSHKNVSDGVLPPGFGVPPNSFVQVALATFYPCETAFLNIRLLCRSAGPSCSEAGRQAVLATVFVDNGFARTTPKSCFSYAPSMPQPCQMSWCQSQMRKRVFFASFCVQCLNIRSNIFVWIRNSVGASEMMCLLAGLPPPNKSGFRFCFGTDNKNIIRAFLSECVLDREIQRVFLAPSLMWSSQRFWPRFLPAHQRAKGIIHNSKIHCTSFSGCK